MSAVTWLLATHNQGKLRELRRILADCPVEIKGLEDLGITAESPETSDEFMGNARQKAAFYHEHSGLPALADDSGLIVDALDGEPGVHSARYGGFPTHKEKVAFVLGRLHDVPDAQRTARFRCAAVFFDGQNWLDAQADVEGYIGYKPVGDKGFGYDPIFHPGSLSGPGFAEYDPDVKNRISHRGRAFNQLVERLRAGGHLG